jgi:3-keto-5-aminohexanoate cleavage enzyme
VLCVSCIGNDFPELELRSQVLELTGRARPDMASLAPGSFDLPEGPNLNPPEMVIALLEKMTSQGIKPELECFDSGMVNAANLLIRQGRIHPPFYFNLLLGSRYGGPATARHLSGMVADLPPGAVWAGAGIGRFQLPVNVLALAMGGHCRTGLEDNIYQVWDRSLLATNAMLVRRIAELAETFGRPLASQVLAREMLGLVAPATCQASARDSSEPGSVAA